MIFCVIKAIEGIDSTSKTHLIDFIHKENKTESIR